MKRKLEEVGISIKNVKLPFDEAAEIIDAMEADGSISYMFDASGTLVEIENVPVTFEVDEVDCGIQVHVTGE